MPKYQEYDITIKSFKETEDSIIVSIEGKEVTFPRESVYSLTRLRDGKGYNLEIPEWLVLEKKLLHLFNVPQDYEWYDH